jgi:hypothetical protein
MSNEYVNKDKPAILLRPIEAELGGPMFAYHIVYGVNVCLVQSPNSVLSTAQEYILRLYCNGIQLLNVLQKINVSRVPT